MASFFPKLAAKSHTIKPYVFNEKDAVAASQKLQNHIDIQNKLKKEFGDLADIERLSDTSIYDWEQKRWVYPFAYLNK